jgi:hypothetical protein
MGEVEFFRAKIMECRQMLERSEDVYERRVYRALMNEFEQRLARALRRGGERPASKGAAPD